jgi:hypothetical protein
MLLAAIAVLVGVFFAATGRGGELSYERADSAPLDLGPVSAADVALLRPPTALWGYNVQVTDEALDVIARAMRDRDVTIAYLQQQLADTNPEAARTAPVPRIPGDTAILSALYDSRPSEAVQPRTSAGPDPVARKDPADEADLVPWDEPAVREGHPGYRDDPGVREEHPSHRDDPGAGESPLGPQGPPDE